MTKRAIPTGPVGSGGWDVDCVLIGVNAAPTLARCIESVRRSRYPRGQIFIYYVDGGSTDESVARARSFAEVRVIEIHPEYPTPGLGRNRGWRAGTSPLVQFLDSDTVLDPGWIDKAAQAISSAPSVGAVRGNRREMYPEASLFNWIADLEWNAPPGECQAFGGDVMIRRGILDATGGYDEFLVGGEDPELSQRIRLAGFTILQLDEPMTRHDLAMTRLHQYWRRAYRTGYGYAAVTLRFLTVAHGFWCYELLRILVRGGGALTLFVAALLGSCWEPSLLLLWLPAMLLLLFPRIFRIAYIMADKSIPQEEARNYAWHCSLIVVPEFFGAMRFVLGVLTGSPLRNHRRVLATRARYPEVP